MATINNGTAGPALLYYVALKFMAFRTDGDVETLSGQELRNTFGAGARCLEAYRDLVNALNVFPVPDGDTGTNMLLTLRAGLDRCGAAGGATAGEAAGRLAEGTFWGARGNSGVILSQFFKGFAGALKDRETCAVTDLEEAFRQACEAAYQAVGTPVEGTMLSVMRAISQGSADGAGADMASAWELAFTSAREALARTPEQLPVLRQAGVVDAGGLGVLAIIGGAWCYLSGRDEEYGDLNFEAMFGRPGAASPGDSLVDSHFREASQEVEWGYCTQFVVESGGAALEQVRRDFARVAESVVVIGDDAHIRVHVHALDPGPAISYGASLGQLSQIKIENMGLQNLDWSGSHTPQGEAPQGTAVVAVAPGDGLARLFRQSGCAAVISGGQSMNPSVQQIMNGVAESGGRDVIILPNNKNVVVAAEQAAGNAGEGRNLWVVPSRTVPQGVAALLAFNPEEPLEANLERMRAALSEVTTVEVTRAVRDATLGAVPVQTGQYIGVVEGELVVVGLTAEATLCAALAHVGLSPDRVVTLYWGAEATDDSAQGAARDLERQAPGMQVDVVYGGQPHYPYLASVE